MTRDDRTYIIRTLVDRYGRKCYYCDSKLSYSNITLDHIRPIQNRTVKDPRSPNCYVLSCFDCNNIKANNPWDIDEFRKVIMGFSYYPIDIHLTKDELKKKRKQERKALHADKSKIIYPEVVLVTPAELWIPPRKGVIHRIIWRFILTLTKI